MTNGKNVPRKSSKLLKNTEQNLLISHSPKYIIEFNLDHDVEIIL